MKPRTDPESAGRSALRLLVQFTNPDLLNRGFEYSVSPKVRNQDSAIQLAIAMQIPENRDAAWNFIKTHWSQVQARIDDRDGRRTCEATRAASAPPKRATT